MSKLNHTTQEFDAAIRKVNKDYADCSNVDATASDVIEGAKIMTQDKTLVSGTIGSVGATPSVTVSGSVVSDTPSPYPITGNASLKVTEGGYIDSLTPGASETRYIKTEVKQGTPSYDENVVLEADENKFLEKVIVEKTPDFVSKVKRVPIYDFYINEMKTNGGYAGMLTAGTLEDNVSVSDVVYLLPVSSNVGRQKILVRVVDPDDGRLVNGVITLHKGDTFVSTASTYTPGGELRFTENGRLQFYHTSSFTVGSSFSSCPMILLNNGVYYVVLVDYSRASHGYVGYGTRVSSGGVYASPNNAQMNFNETIGYHDYSKPKCMFGNLTNIYWYSDVDKSGGEFPRMTFNYGSGRSVLCEVEQ